MKQLIVTALLVLAPSIALADRSYNQSSEKVTHDCAKEPEVALNGSDSTFTFTGTCMKIAINGSSIKATIVKVDKLAVNGSSNTVTVDAAEKISVNGSDNTINYKKGISKDKPKVSTLGAGNRVVQTK